MKLTAANHQQSPFFRLPGELRNEIYGYVLTSPFGVRCVYTGTTNGRVYRMHSYLDNGKWHAAHEEFNQLRYVCRQLYQETSGHFVLENNDIEFFSSFGNNFIEMPATRVCARFLEDCSSVYKKNLRNMSIYQVHPGFGSGYLHFEPLYIEDFNILQHTLWMLPRLSMTVFYRREHIEKLVRYLGEAPHTGEVQLQTEPDSTKSLFPPNLKIQEGKPHQGAFMHEPRSPMLLFESSTLTDEELLPVPYPDVVPSSSFHWDAEF
jgi:hypothetical protein